MRTTAMVCAAAWALGGCSGTVAEVGAGGATSSTGTTTPTDTYPTATTPTDTTTVTTTTSTAACDLNLEDITGWQVAGATPQKYQMGTDPSVSCNGDPSISLSSTTASAAGDFGTLMAIRSAATYQGQRLRLRGSIRTDAVTGWAGMWMRVDGQSQQVLSFDNMMNRAVVGTTDWTQFDVVLDVAPKAIDIAYGILLSNEGAVWLDGVSLQIVDKSVPTTGW